MLYVPRDTRPIARVGCRVSLETEIGRKTDNCQERLGFAAWTGRWLRRDRPFVLTTVIPVAATIGNPIQQPVAGRSTQWAIDEP
jgi:hypothetical protein